MNLQFAKRVILYADIVGSTALYEALGNTKARRIVGDGLALLRRVALNHHGLVIAELGDEIMCSFGEPGDAAAAANEMHAALGAGFRPDEGAAPVRARIGAHWGPVEAGDESSSETARIAHWAAGNAKAEQTLATAAFVDGLPRIYQAVSRFVDEETWNFVSIEHVALHEIIWDVEAITACNAEHALPAKSGYSSVCFRLGDQSIVVDEQRPVISIGRERENDLVVADELVSRQHISAQFSRGRCTITDRSTNGTVLVPRGGIRQELKRETLPLTGSGLIIMGHPTAATEKSAVHYECR